MVAGDVDHLYLRYGDCRGADCVIKVAATADGGRTWTSSPLPVTHNALVSLAALGPLTVLAEVQQGGATVTQSWLASTDGGHTWHAVSVRQVDAIPTGWQILDGPPGVDQIAVLAADPATGALAELGQGRPLHLGRPVAGLPPAAGLWLTGYLGTAPSPAPSPYGDQQIRVGTGSTVAVSHDGGRTWHQQTFAEPLTANTGLGGATVASYDGRTAYAVGAANGELVVHRTDDGGLTWRRTPAQAHVGEALLAAAVRADGTLLVQVGYQAGDHPVMYESTDRGATLRAVPIGPGASAVPVDGGYAQSDWPNTSGAWLSPEGTAWSYVAPPALP